MIILATKFFYFLDNKLNFKISTSEDILSILHPNGYIFAASSY